MPIEVAGGLGRLRAPLTEVSGFKLLRYCWTFVDLQISCVSLVNGAVELHNVARDLRPSDFSASHHFSKFLRRVQLALGDHFELFLRPLLRQRRSHFLEPTSCIWLLLRRLALDLDDLVEVLLVGLFAPLPCGSCCNDPPQVFILPDHVGSLARPKRLSLYLQIVLNGFSHGFAQLLEHFLRMRGLLCRRLPSLLQNPIRFQRFIDDL